MLPHGSDKAARLAIPANVLVMMNMSTPDVYAERATEAAIAADDEGSTAIAYALLAVAASIDRLATVHQAKE